MNDQQLGDRLRATLAAHADTVTHGPGWDATDELIDTPRRRIRWIAPLAAAAVVLLVVGGVFAFRSSDHSPTPAAAPQLPIPKGMKAVDALGVEIFVPKSMTVDAGPCESGVSRPIAQPRSWVGAKCPPPPPSLARVAITPLSGALHPGLGVACTGDTVTLGDEATCVFESMEGADNSGAIPFEASWPRHQVSVITQGISRALALRIIESAHAVPIDRNGCSATNQSLQPSPIKNIPDPADIHVTPKLPNSGALGVCLYTSGHRLAASAKLTGHGATTVLSRANAITDSFDHACDRVTLNGMDELVLDAGRSTRTFFLPSCGGPGFTSLTAAVTGLAHIPVD